jgi:DNA-binding NarL/FixJ family response regulator
VPTETIDERELVRVAAISPVRVYAQGLTQLFHKEHGIELVWSTPGIDAAERLLAHGGVDVILLDMTGDIAGDRGLVMLYRLADSGRPPLVVLGIPDRPADVVAYAEAGIAGYVTNEHTFADLVDTLRSATRGEFPWASNIAAGVMARLAVLAREYRRSPVAQLTAREMEIVGLIDVGLSNKEIARQLHIQLATVKNHVHKILEKLGVGSRLDAVAAVRRQQAFATR